jgi:thiol-disulfide isomerase/thioredoxin
MAIYGLLYSVITGTTTQDQFITFNRKLFDLENNYEKKYLLYKKESKNADSLNKLDELFSNNKYDLILKEVKANPSSIVSAYIANNNINDDIKITTLEDIYNSLNNKNNYYSNLLLKILNARKHTSIGLMAPAFSIIDNKNRSLTNATFKGKYLLIDFWASWCIPCRKENSYLVTAYNKYSHKGLEIISISLDKNKMDWEVAVKKDKLTWIQACDLKGGKSEIAGSFGFQTIPTNFLLDREGRIVDKNLRGNKLEKVLQEQLENN